ncbi:hypothetical protein [Pseudomonas atacamensis]|uniref:hypothetical protein n=1 Tax=Pseudomonas atacamensis TaxID=2565368 RepID=UPI0019D21F2C|nr:hypothetical protein [Pseudomonas atacamensis]QSL90434.1 hypothetical protein JWU58_26720 [Pseudomonas atacamensis]
MSDSKKAGRPPKKVEIQRFNAQLEQQLNRKLKMLAADRNKTPSDVLNDLIRAQPWPKIEPEDDAAADE